MNEAIQLQEHNGTRGMFAAAALLSVTGLVLSGCDSAPKNDLDNFNEPYRVASTSQVEAGPHNTSVTTFSARYRDSAGKPDHGRPFEGIMVGKANGTVDVGVVSPTRRVGNKYLNVTCLADGRVTAYGEDNWDGDSENFRRITISHSFAKKQELCDGERVNTAAGAANIAMRLYNAEDNGGDSESKLVAHDKLPISLSVNSFTFDHLNPVTRSHTASKAVKGAVHRAYSDPEGKYKITLDVSSAGIGKIALHSDEGDLAYSGITCRKDGGVQGALTVDTDESTTAALPQDMVRDLSLCTPDGVNKDINLRQTVASISVNLQSAY